MGHLTVGPLPCVTNDLRFFSWLRSLPLYRLSFCRTLIQQYTVRLLTEPSRLVLEK